MVLITTGKLGPWLQTLLETGPAPWVLAPFRWVVAPYFAESAGAFFVAAVPALAIMALHFFWVVRADLSFEDASIQAAAKRAAFLAARQRGELRAPAQKGTGRVAPFQLASTGFVPLAFLWKSLIRFGGRTRLLLWGAGLGIVALMAEWLRRQGTLSPAQTTLATVLAALCYGTLLFSFVLVGQNAAMQLRQGLRGMDLLKSYPIPGWQLALGELLGPLVLGTGLQWCAIGSAILLAHAFSGPNFGFGAMIGGGVMAFLLPVLNLSISILPSGLTLLFPGWFKSGEQSAQGLESTGLRLIAGVAQFLALGVALIPVIFFGLATWFAAGFFTTDLRWVIGLTAAVSASLLAMEAALGVAWLGWLYDRYDVSGE
jgi:type IV secretory pathway VirB2 component (pilin)